METFGEEMEARFGDFDKDEYGRPLSKSQVRRKKKQAKRELKRAVRRGWLESGFNADVKIVDEEAADDEDGYLTEEESMRRRVEKRVRKRREEFQGLMWHIVIFVLINSWLFGFGDWIGQALEGNITFPSIITFFWGIGLFSHFFDYYNKYGPGYRRRENLIEREIERERRKTYDDSDIVKAKHGEPSLRLTEDGEFTDSFVEDQDEYYDRGGQ